MSQGDALTDLERSILLFERRWWHHTGAKDQAILDLFDMTPTRYYQTLLALLDHPAAWQFDPVLVKRLNRLRDARRLKSD